MPTSRRLQVVLERNTRNKKKCITTISGLDMFGVKLGEASKLFGKKFASGASITKNAEGKEQIDCQVRCRRVCGPVTGAGGCELVRLSHQRRCAAVAPPSCRLPTLNPTRYHPAAAPPLLQGDFLDQAVELVLKTYKEVKKQDIYVIENKKRVKYFDKDEGDA